MNLLVAAGVGDALFHKPMMREPRVRAITMSRTESNARSVVTGQRAIIVGQAPATPSALTRLGPARTPTRRTRFSTRSTGVRCMPGSLMAASLARFRTIGAVAGEPAVGGAERYAGIGRGTASRRCRRSTAIRFATSAFANSGFRSLVMVIGPSERGSLSGRSLADLSRHGKSPKAESHMDGTISFALKDPFTLHNRP